MARMPRSVRALPATLAAALLLLAAPHADARDIVVGGAVGWGLGMRYPDIAAEVGDTLVFNYMPMHDVWSMPAAGCAFEGGLELAGADASPFRYTLASPGRFHFACSISSHCAGGQARGGALLSVCGQGSCVHCDRLTCDCSQAVSVDVAPSGSAQPQGATCARFLGVFTSC